MRRSIRWLVAVALWSLLGSFLAAQSTTSLHGVVSDAKGAVLPGATLRIYDAQTGFARTVTSGADGVYQFLQIPPATYALTVSEKGFANIQQQGDVLAPRLSGSRPPPA